MTHMISAELRHGHFLTVFGSDGSYDALRNHCARAEERFCKEYGRPNWHKAPVAFEVAVKGRYGILNIPGENIARAMYEGRVRCL